VSIYKGDTFEKSPEILRERDIKVVYIDPPWGLDYYSSDKV
jgi:16S rRNA G966 N2-methylase RsmD